MALIAGILSAPYRRWKALWRNLPPGERLAPLLVRIGSVLLLYVAIDRLLMMLTKLPTERFEEPFIFLAFFKHLTTTWLSVALFPLLILAVFFRKRLAAPWSTFRNGNSVRFLVLLSAGVMVWSYSTSDYNLISDQTHYPDRILLFVLLVFLYWRPVFTFPFLIALLPLIWESADPGGASWAFPYIPTRIIFLVFAFFLIYLPTKRFRADDFVFFLGILIATHYWVPGFGKMSWDWVRNDQVFYLLSNTYANGWLGFLSPETISTATRHLFAFSLPSKLFALIFECGGILFFLHRRSPIILLAGWSLLHIGILLISGIFFWVWIVIELGLIFLFIRNRDFTNLPIFSSKAHIVISILLIVTGGYWCRPARLAWFDSPITYTYRIEAEFDSGKISNLAPVFFEPFGVRFTLGNFHFLNKEKSLPIVWGATSGEVARDLESKTTSDEIFKYEEKIGRRQYDSQQAVDFDTFIKRYLKNWNKRRTKSHKLSLFQSPRNILTFPRRIELSTDEPIRQVDVYQITTAFRNGSYYEVRRRLVREIPIPD